MTGKVEKKVERISQAAGAPRPRTNRIVVMIALIIVIGCLVGLELFASSPFVQNFISIRSLGFQHYFFEIKWLTLEKFVQENYGIDVVFLGNSMVNTGVDIDSFNVHFGNITGITPRSFNFGLDGLNLTATSEVVKLLIENYSTNVIVFGTEARDFTRTEDVTYSVLFTRTPWLNYRLGRFSPYGWLVDHSAFLKIFLNFRNWAQDDFQKQFTVIKHHWRVASQTGYVGDKNIMDWTVPQPNFENPVELERKNQYKNFEFDDEKFQLLGDLIRYCTEHGVLVIILEMPITDQFYQYFSEPEVVKQEYEARVQATTENAGGLFITAPSLSVITPGGWANLNHMNIYGANNYSKYLAIVMATNEEIIDALTDVDGTP